VQNVELAWVNCLTCLDLHQAMRSDSIGVESHFRGECTIQNPWRVHHISRIGTSGAWELAHARYLSHLLLGT
jgi:hypothetical protein